MKPFIGANIALLLLFQSGCASGEEAAPPVPVSVVDAVEADPAHYSIEFENDVVQLIRIAYGTGERSVMHSHPANCTVLLTDTNFTMTPLSGDPETNEGAMGDVDCGDGYVHLPENAGGDAEAVMIALKGRDIFDTASASPGTAVFSDVPNAVTADPDHYKVEFENDVVRVIRISYPPGEQSVMHSHWANCTVGLSVFTASETLPSGEVVTGEPGAVGTAGCGDATTHRPQNIGTTNAELVLVELKNRETFE